MSRKRQVLQTKRVNGKMYQDPFTDLKKFKNDYKNIRYYQPFSREVDTKEKPRGRPRK